MRALLDTHALIWTLNNDPKLSPRARAILSNPEVEQFVSAATAMELFTKHRLGKLPEAQAIVENWEIAMMPPGYTALPITLAHARQAGSLQIPNKDPFDRFLIAQAQIEDLVLISNESQFDNFGVQRLW